MDSDEIPEALLGAGSPPPRRPEDEEYNKKIRARLQALVAAAPQRPPIDPKVWEAWDEAEVYDRHLTRLAEKWSWEDALALMKASPVERARAIGNAEYRESIWDLGERAHVPGRVVELLAEGPLVETPAIVAARGFAESGKTFLLLLGGVGSGKTVAACTTMLAYRRREVIDPVSKTKQRVLGAINFAAMRFVRATEISRLSVYDDSERWAELREVYALVLDDLGVETLTDVWRERVEELVDVRYGERLPTVITSNFSAAEFRERYGERVASRINSDGIVAACGAVDLRAAKTTPTTPTPEVNQ